jgi:ribosomal protein S18 acetylase RimI-like enzyme
MTTFYTKLGVADIAVLDYDVLHDQDSELRLGYQITRINVPAKHREQGHARALLKQMLAKADSEGESLYLWVLPSDGLTRQQLVAWYQRHGFQYQGRTKWMMRQPQSEVRQ